MAIRRILIVANGLYRSHLVFEAMLFLTLLVSLFVAQDIPMFTIPEIPDMLPAGIREASKIRVGRDGIIHIFDGEDLDDFKIPSNLPKIHIPYGKWFSTDADTFQDGGINWSEITKIAGQVHQIGQILGFDAEDADNFLRMSDQRIWNNWQKKEQEKAKQQKYQQMVQDNIMQLKAQQEAQAKFAKMNTGKKFRWSWEWRH